MVYTSAQDVALVGKGDRLFSAGVVSKLALRLMRIFHRQYGQRYPLQLLLCRFCFAIFLELRLHPGYGTVISLALSVPKEYREGNPRDGRLWEQPA